MSIKYAILGLLSWKPATGYELKKFFEESSAMYWSGNNNQIYKSLVQLLDEGLVTNEVCHQESSPSKKIYTITEEGMGELKEWVLTDPQSPELKKSFLTQLAWADQLNSKELDGLLSRYESEINMQLLFQHEKIRRGQSTPARSPREILLWDMISDNLISSLENELAWIRKLRKELVEKEMIKDDEKMKFEIIENQAKKYIEVLEAETPLCTDRDAADLVAMCWENDTKLMMLHGDILCDDFFKLKTGVAGNMMQKFTNYGIKVAAIVPDEVSGKGRFREMVSEGNKGNQFGVFSSREAAESWLIR